jgi:peptide/nickel transport system ATP-binding protein
MYAGKIAELADVDTIFYEPRHAYTHGLLSGLTRLDHRRADRLEPIPGQPPSLIYVPTGCAFHPRCKLASQVCKDVVPALVPQDRPGHLAACHHSDQVALLVNGPAAAERVAPAAAATTAAGTPVTQEEKASS